MAEIRNSLNRIEKLLDEIIELNSKINVDTYYI